jgi:hypothetical protein
VGRWRRWVPLLLGLTFLATVIAGPFLGMPAAIVVWLVGIGVLVVVVVRYGYRLPWA